MRIGIVPYLDRSEGGTYQYSETMAHTLFECNKEQESDEFVVFAPQAEHPGAASSEGPRCLRQTLDPAPERWRRPMDALGWFIGEGPHREAWRWMRRRLQHLGRKPALQANGAPPDPYHARAQPEMNRWFRRCGIDLMVYPAPVPLSFEAGIPYIIAVHDLQHRLQPEFPEVSADGEWESREYQFRNVTRFATLVLADSEVGKEDILNCYSAYGITEDRVKVLPYLPAHYLGVEVSESDRQRVRAHYRLPDRYLFYPSTFWPHKNHARLVQALGLVKREYQLEIPIVLCGPHTRPLRERTFQEAMTLARGLGIEGQVHYLGYAGDEDMSALYAEAEALVMPTFFGPTAIPLLEAWAFGCPVITSDIRGIRDQMADAAVLVDPRSVESIAGGIARLWKDQALREELIVKGRKRLMSYTPGDFAERLKGILEEAKDRVRRADKRRWPRHFRMA